MPGAGGWEIRIPRFDPDRRQPILWVQKTFANVVQLIVRKYDDPASEIVGSTFGASTGFVTYVEFAEILERGGSEISNLILITSRVISY